MPPNLVASTLAAPGALLPAPELLPLLALALAALAALLACAGIVRWQHTHAHLLQDHDLDGVQKFHTRPVPRVGGVGVALALALSLLGAWGSGWLGPDGAAALLLLLAALPAFAAGLAEDMTKRVGVLARLGATMTSAALAWWWLGADLNRLGLPWVDAWLLQWPLLSLALTLVAVAGVANAINIIDSFLAQRMLERSGEVSENVARSYNELVRGSAERRGRIAVLQARLAGVAESHVLAPPQLPLQAVSPRPLMVAALAGLAAGFALVLLVLVRHAWCNAASNPASSEKVRAIRNALRWRQR